MFRSSALRLSSSTFFTQSNLSSLSGSLPRFGSSMAAVPSSATSSSGSSSSSSGSSGNMLIDHLVIDASSLTSAAIRLARGSSAQQENEICSRVVSEVVHHTRRVQPRRSLVLLLDGSEGVWKAAKTRGKGSSKKAEERAARGPGSGLSLAVENALLDSFADRRVAPPEVVVSGSCVPGSIETKAALWAAGVARRPRAPEDDPDYFLQQQQRRQQSSGGSKHSNQNIENQQQTLLFAAQTDTVAYFGPNDLYFHLITSPFLSSNLISISQGTNEAKCITKRNLVDWLGFGRAMTASAARLFAMMNTNMGSSSSSVTDTYFQNKRNFPDAVPPPSAATKFQSLQSLNDPEVQQRMAQEMSFLILLAQGHGGYELSGVPQLSGAAGLQDLLTSYWKVATMDIVPASSTTAGETHQQQQPGAENDNREGENEVTEDSPSRNCLPDMFKNEVWLLDRDAASDQEGLARTTAKILQRLGERSDVSPGQVALSVSPPSESFRFVPRRFGINVDVLRKVLNYKSGPSSMASSGSRQQQKEQQGGASSSSSSSQVVGCDGIGCIFATPACNAEKRAVADAAAYLDCVLQIFHLLTLGKAPLPGFFLPSGFVHPSVSSLQAYLRFLSKRSRPEPAILYPLSVEDLGGISAKGTLHEHKSKSSSSSSSRSQLQELHSQPLTAAEYALLNAGSARHFADLASTFVGQKVSDSFAARVTAGTKSIPEALKLVRALLKYSNASSPHRALCFSPSVCLVEVAGKSPELQEWIRQEQLKEEQEMAVFEQQKQQQQQQQSASGSSMHHRVAMQPQRKVATKYANTKSHWRMFPVELGS